MNNGVTFPDVQSRFFSKVAKTDTCWLWIASLDRDGYGQFWLNKTLAKAHRVAWAITHGDILDGLTVDHVCRVRHCVNPEHLRLLTNEENASDARRYAALNKKIN